MYSILFVKFRVVPASLFSDGSDEFGQRRSDLMGGVFLEEMPAADRISRWFGQDRQKTPELPVAVMMAPGSPAMKSLGIVLLANANLVLRRAQEGQDCYSKFQSLLNCSPKIRQSASCMSSERHDKSVPAI